MTARDWSSRRRAPPSLAVRSNRAHSQAPSRRVLCPKVRRGPANVHPLDKGNRPVKMIRLALFALVLTAGGVGACLCHRAVTGWEDANHPDPARQRELEILEDYTREADAIFQKHGRVMTPEWEKEEEELRRATRRRLAELRGCE